MKRLRVAFITGCLVMVPLLATAQILVWLVRTIDANIRDIFPTSVLPFDFGGLGLIFAFLCILITGVLAQNYIGKLLLDTFDHALRRVAIVGGLYSSIRKFLETVLNPQSDQFTGTVLVQFPRTGVYSIGFRTGKPDSKLTSSLPDKKFVNIFVPCTPNPTSGFYLLVPESDIIPLDLSVQEAFKTVISLGIVTSEEVVVGPKK